MTDIAESTQDRERDPRWRTADGVPITDGLVVWTNDLRPAVVALSESDHDRPHWDGWFQVLELDGHPHLCNGERMAVRHPFTREAPTAWDDPLREGLVAQAQAGARLAVADDEDDGKPIDVEYLPRAAGDPTPWRDTRHYRRHRSEAVSVRTA